MSHFQLAAVFAMQGIGILIGALAFIIVLSCYSSQISNDYTYLDYVWRIVIGIGVIPAFFALYFRLTIPETPRYTIDVHGDTLKAARDVERVLEMNNTPTPNHSSGSHDDETPVARIEVTKNTFDDFCNHFGKVDNFLVLFAVSYCWFALDIAW
jgi:MFS transporter, PHS family, inorganic phosphate transporter